MSSSLKSQDKTIEDISKKLNVANMSLSKLEEVLTQHEKALDAMRKNLSDNATSIVDTISLNKSIKGLKETLDISSAQNAKEIKMNRWFIVAAFVILTILTILNSILK